MSSSLLAGSFVASIIPGFWVSCYFSFVFPYSIAVFAALECGKFENLIFYSSTEDAVFKALGVE